MVFEKRVDGVIEAVEIVVGSSKHLLNKTMWKQPSAEGGDARMESVPANTSETAAAPSLYKNVADFIEKSKPSAVVDENGQSTGVTY